MKNLRTKRLARAERVTTGGTPRKLVSVEEIEAKRTPRGGFTRPQLKAWGVDWPPTKGWIGRLSGTDKPPVIAPTLARLTEAEILAGMSNGCGVSRKQLAAWGLPWPPPKNWKRFLLVR